jgi:transaldolase
MAKDTQISAVLTDVDGTLLTQDKVLTERARRAVEKLRERGISFTITSGRPPFGMKSLVEPLGLTLPMAAFNGGVCLLPDMSILDERLLPEYMIPALIQMIEAQGLDVFVFRSADWFVRSLDAPRVARETSTIQQAPVVVASFDEVTGDVVKITGVSNDHARVAACEAAMQKMFGRQLSVARSQPYYLDITHPDANKGVVIERLSRYLKIPFDRIATLGDQPNDVLMFERSGLSVAMGNASDEVKKRATFVTSSYSDEGFAHAVESIILPHARPATGADTRPTAWLHRLGASLWLDNITRELLQSGALAKMITELSLSGLTSNPTIFEQAIQKGKAYDSSITALARQHRHPEDIFFELALSDITQAADLFRPIHERSAGVDGWASLEVSPLLANDAAATLAAAKSLHARAGRPNVMIKIPGTEAGNIAIEEAIFEGIPINVTLLFSREQYLASAEAFLRGIERRIDAGKNPDVASVASVFISRWDREVAGKVPKELEMQLGIAIAQRTYKAYRSVLASPRWQRIYNAGARSQRLLWASTGVKDPKFSDITYVQALTSPFTVITIPQATLEAFADHGAIVSLMPADGGTSEQMIAKLTAAGVDVYGLATRLQDEGARNFVASWNHLMSFLASKAAALAA